MTGFTFGGGPEMPNWGCLLFSNTSPQFPPLVARFRHFPSPPPPLLARNPRTFYRKNPPETNRIEAGFMGSPEKARLGNIR